ncbi:precorrin-2 dehydrogenase/sirohydrochlorin ferrochelatase family protein [Staphylococcus debuckii]|uniref:precorrin-2 dehydrogenase/sirohydrochlorin ferrochelatase family protein n=1 Tax=Staphylococcus debuckii TaxID=2044912 RepID=UPI000F42D86E|nr:bifunctional precorrin-2 dehydrogenase/sirohydrochlorin ferrochelatase [Staphylococcus debuckii]AYU56016.1 bifunctional precorrin-2 dehydrogenase/sirohydrochlorin ferrochelatase [Staphylococcus debuckii]
MYPIQLNLKNKNVVLIGGGRIGYRKFKHLAKADYGSVTVISKTFLPEFFEQCYPDIKLITKDYDKEDIAEADIVIIATDSPEINDKIKQDTTPEQLVNHTGDKSQSDFFNMREFDFEDLAISVRSNGGDYKKAKQVSKAIEKYLREEYGRE